jgi:hypothetical protein
MPPTVLPSVALWLADVPIREESFDFCARADIPYFLANPSRYDRVLISIGNFPDGAPFLLDSIEAYRSRWATRASLIRMIEAFNDIGKRPLFYLGGIHGPSQNSSGNAAAWDYAGRTWRLEARLQSLFEIFPARPDFECDFAFDATSRVYRPHHVEPRLFSILEAKGATCYTESRASALSCLADRPSLTMAGTARTRLVQMPDAPHKHAVLCDGSSFASAIPLWRSQGRSIYVNSADFNIRTHELPDWWTLVPPSSPSDEPAPEAPIS